MRFRTVLVAGAGQMGSGIAQVMAASGRSVILVDPAVGACEQALDRIGRGLERRAARGEGETSADVLARITRSDTLVPADLLVEAIVEDRAAKEELFRRADTVMAPESVFASNTSSISISRIAAATGRPDRVIGMHFFNPVPAMALVEVIRGSATSDETAAAITELAHDLGKTPAACADAPGFVANRILMPFINEAVQALDENVADAETIDSVARLGLNHPMGPLALADLIGLDTCVAIMDVLREGFDDPRYEPSSLLRRHVEAGRLGRKSGQGFYDYSGS